MTEKKGYYYNEQGILSHGVISKTEIEYDERLHVGVLNNLSLLDAMAHYAGGDGKTMVLHASIIDFSQMTKDDLSAHKDKNGNKTGIYSVQLLTAPGAFQNMNVALCLGKITLQHIEGERYRILTDKYDFDIPSPKNLNDGVRNVLTIGADILHRIYISSCNVPDNAVNGHLNPYRKILQGQVYNMRMLHGVCVYHCSSYR